LCNDEQDAGEALHKLAGGYADMLGMEVTQVLSAVETAQRTAVAEDAVAVRPLKRGEPRMESGGRKPSNAPTSPVGKPGDAAAILTRGVADIRGAMQSASTTQLLTMALETVYQGLGFSRAVAFLRNQDRQQYSARMCFGDGLQELMPKLVFGDAYQPDVFHAALANDKMIFVENAQDPAFISKVPRWWRDALPTVRSFMVLPLTINRQPVGFIYGDWDISRPAARIEQAEVTPLNELRLLVMRAFEVRRQMEPAWARTLS
jgi:transcriptional regulator with GAF, ATPase, and Fis domain